MSATSENQTDTYETLQEILNLFNGGYSQLRNGIVTSYLSKNPNNDIEIIWSIKRG